MTLHASSLPYRRLASLVAAQLAAWKLDEHTQSPFTTHGPVADLVDLPTTITHGMWTCANARRVLETWVNRNEPKRLEEFEVKPTLPRRPAPC